MGRKGRNRHRDESRQPARKRFTRFVLPAFCIVAGGTLVAIAINNQKNAQTCQPSLPRCAQKAKSLDELLKMSPEQLAAVDIAELNLHCAEGLPGAERLDIAKCLAHLDDWARRVKFDTDRHLYKFDKNPAEYENSEGYFRMLMLVTVLQQDCGVHYNLERIRNIDFTKSKDLFIHGMIDDPNGGTCVTMPVMYVAVARRLGYPVKLVLTKAHVFCRWDAPGERFNIEATNQGMNCFSDEYYKTWPEKWTTAETQSNRYLISLTPAEELACFLGSRGHCLLDNGHAKEALDTYAAARRLAPLDPAYPSWMRMAETRLGPTTYAHIGPEGFPEPPMVYGPSRDEIEFRRVEAINANTRHLLEQNARRIGIPSPYGPRPPAPYEPQLPSPYSPQPRRPGIVPGQP